MAQTKKNITRKTIAHVNEAGRIVIIQRRSIDYTMHVVAELTNGLTSAEAEKYSGNVSTGWNNGGFREPNGFTTHPKIKEFANIDSLYTDLKATVPPGFTGKAIFKMNGGEVVGKPILVP